MVEWIYFTSLTKHYLFSNSTIISQYYNNVYKINSLHGISDKSQ